MLLTEIEKHGGEEEKEKGCFIWGWGRVEKIMLEFGLLILKCLQNIQGEMVRDRCENGVR